MTTNIELSDEQIAEIAESVQAPTWGDFQVKFARAVEREIRFALSAVSRSEVGEPAPVVEPVAQAEYVIRLLVAAGHVTQQKVDEAFAIAKEYASPLPPSEAQGDQQ